jgi:hypothetical protein
MVDDAGHVGPAGVFKQKSTVSSLTLVVEAEVSAPKPFKIWVKQATVSRNSATTYFPDFDF